ncbi:hypothetical protein [Xanthomonas albilineans]|uniref:hypothetical protein n=1 Tax=Xanthomonas albilineans TaxID=29447 RepID=UPI000A41C5AE|nr:hypothetical protein [Xanthomonas albilineans]
MSDKVILQNETVMSVCIDEAAASARCETARFDALHEQLLQLASISESSSENEKDDELEIDRTKQHAFAQNHINMHTDCIERLNYPALSLIAAPAETARGYIVQPRHDDAHPGPACKPRQEGNIENAKNSQYVEPPLTRESAYNVWLDVIPVTKSYQAVHHATVISRLRRDGDPRSSHAPVTHSVAKTHATALYESGLAAYCWSMSRLVIDAQTTEEVSDRYDCDLIDNQSTEFSAYAPVEKHVGPIRTRRQFSCTGKDKVESVAHSTSSRVKSVAAYVPSMDVAPACRQSSAEDMAAHGEATPWRLHYIFRSWNGDPSIELVRDPASLDRTDRTGRLMVAVTASNNEVSTAAQRMIERALARDDAPAELAGATLTSVCGVTA